MQRADASYIVGVVTRRTQHHQAAAGCLRLMLQMLLVPHGCSELARRMRTLSRR